MDRATKSEVLLRYVTALEDKYGSVSFIEENGDKLFKEMRSFVIKFFENDDSPSSRDGGNFQWTEEDENYLKENYASKSTKEIAYVLGQDPVQIRTKAWRLGLKKKKNDIEPFIIKNHKELNGKEIAEALGIPYSSAYYYLKKMKKEGKLGDPSQLDSGQLKMWTEEEEDYLAKHYPTTNASDIAKALGRSKSSVRSKAYSLGIK